MAIGPSPTAEAMRLDRTVQLVAGYLLAGLALIVRTDVACGSPNQVTACSADWKKSVFVQYFSSSRSWLSKKPYHAFRYLQSILMANR